MNRQELVFNSVFKPSGHALSQPTPFATPATAITAPENAIGSHSSHYLQRSAAKHEATDHGQWTTTESEPSGDSADDPVTWDRSWHIVTSTISTASASFLPHATDGVRVEKAGNLKWPANFYSSLETLVSSSSRVPLAGKSESISSWVIEHIRNHFLEVVGPWLLAISEEETGETLLKMTFDALKRARNHYHAIATDITDCLSKESPKTGKMLVETTERDFKILARSTLPQTTWAMIKWYLSHSISVILAVPDEFELDEALLEAARLDLMNFVGMLTKSGLAGERFHIMVADVMHRCMSAFVYGTYSRVWAGRRPNSACGSNAKAQRRLSHQLRDSLAEDTSYLGDDDLVPRVVNHIQASWCVEAVCTWTEDMYARLAVEILSATESDEVTYDDLQNWKEMSIGRLAGLRTSELFDIVVNWPNSHGALDDLRTATTTPQDRLLLTEAFTQQLKERLLHPGASTLQILRIYIAMIRSFHALDHSKVLLDRVSFPLQIYLCSREDTARVVIAGLLADTVDEDGNAIDSDDDKLVELALLLHQGPQETDGQDDDMDWNDMSWVPDPVDAGPGYKRSNNVDIIGTLINVLGSQEIFTKEFQKILGEHLLKNNDHFQNEVCWLVTAHMGLR